MDNTQAIIMDPEDGKLHKTDLGELEEEWSGFIVALAPSPSFQKGDRRTPVLARFREILLYYRKELAMVLAGSAAFIAATGFSGATLVTAFATLFAAFSIFIAIDFNE